MRAGWSDAVVAGELLDALATTTEPARAAEVSLAILAPRLRGVVTRWRRCGVPSGDLEDMEADLLAETLSGLVCPRPPLRPGPIVDAAWARVRAGRRRQLTRLARQVPLDISVLTTAPAPPVALEAGWLIIDTVREGSLSLLGAQAVWLTGIAGWPARQAADRLGCRPDALRARRSRAIRALSA